MRRFFLELRFSFLGDGVGHVVMVSGCPVSAVKVEGMLD